MLLQHHLSIFDDTVADLDSLVISPQNIYQEHCVVHGGAEARLIARVEGLYSLLVRFLVEPVGVVLGEGHLLGHGHFSHVAVVVAEELVEVALGFFGVAAAAQAVLPQELHS